MRVRCPHCQHVANIVKSVNISQTYRELTCVCKNDECGCIFIASIEPRRTLTQPQKPNIEVNIPLSRKKK